MKPAILRALFATVVLASAPAGRAQDPAVPDSASWPCRYCTFESGTAAWLEPAAGYVSDPSYHFGDFTGLENDGALFDLSGAFRYRDAETADRWTLRADRLGLESREVGLRGGRQGIWDLHLDYARLEHRVDARATSPFRLAGDAALELPAGWVTAGSTGAMSELDNSLKPADLGLRRDRLRAGFKIAPTVTTEFGLNYRHDRVEGVRETGAAFMTLASQLPEPVDQSVERFDVSAAWRHALGSAHAQLVSSFFFNELDSLSWQNPFTPLAPGADGGELAAAPDNHAHRLSLALASGTGAALQSSGQVTLGRQYQDQRFLPATANPDLAADLPRNSLDGRVETFSGSARVRYRAGWKLQLRADALHDVRDNLTPVDLYPQVVMDTVSGFGRTNAPYGYTRDRLRFGIERAASLPVSLGVELDQRDRRPAARGETRERTGWAQVGGQLPAGGDLRLRWSRGTRDVADLAAEPGAPAQNPLLAPFDRSRRVRDEMRADLAFSAARFGVGLHARYGRNDYPDTQVGRTRDEGLGGGAELTLRPREGMHLTAFASREQLETIQTGSQVMAMPDWLAQQDDVGTVAGFHGATVVAQDIELGADYVFSASDGSVALVTGNAESEYPVLVSRWHDARLFARWPLRPGLTLRFDVEREIYRAQDWARDGVGPDTVGNLLALGAGSRTGRVTAVFGRLRYEF